ncbi:MAG: phosphotransferase [Clostridiales bacterium]|nr:phosphotransferase [Clostridiales bacterium]
MSFEGKEIISKQEAKIIYREGDCTVKSFNEDYSKAMVLNEALNQARVEETGLNIAKVREVRKDGERWAIVLDYIPGKTLAELMQLHPEREDEYLKLFVSLQMEVHSKTCPMLGRLTEKMHRKIDLTSFSDTIKYELHTRLDGMPKHNKLCHGDFNPTNIIITDEGTPYIIDWAHATQGNASADVARTFLLFNLEGKVELAEKYIELFCKMSGTDRRYVNKWIPIVAASQSVKGKKGEETLLRRWVDVVEYE